MKQRGRPSSNIIPLPANTPPPEPPSRLCPAAAEIWRAACASMRPGWFGAEVAPLLEAYAVQAAVAQLVGEHLQSLSVDDPGYRRLSNMHSKASAMMRTLATTLRLTPQSNKRSIRDGRDPLGGSLKKPWEDWCLTSVRLTDEQLDAVLRATKPLLPTHRDRFLQALAEALQGRQDIGDGELFLAIRTIQHQHFDPPQIEPD